MNFTDYVFGKVNDLNKNAVFFSDKWKSYNELQQEIFGVIMRIQQEKIEKGSRIALISENSPFFIAVYFGIIGSGCACVPISPTSQPAEAENVMKLCSVKYTFIQKKFAKKFYREDLKFLTEDSITPGSAAIQGVNEKTEPALILFTSGSTGKPKGVVLSHRNLIHNTESIIKYLEISEKDRVLATLPFSYTFGLSWVNTVLKAGGEIVIENSFVPIGKILSAVNKYECTGFAGVPTTFQLLLRTTDIKKMRFPTLRFVAQAGGKLPDNFIKELVDIFGSKRVVIMYGQTEATARLSYLPPSELERKLGSIGKGIPGTKLEVLDIDGNPVKPGEIGEIVASGDNVMLGYFGMPEETAEVKKNGKLYTGDLATVDEDGFIFVIGREKNIIKTRGIRVNPAEIEGVITEIPNVVEVAVVGVPDSVLGEAIKAFVVLKKPDPMFKQKMIDFCKKKLQLYKVPQHVSIVSDLPKNSSGKIIRNQVI